MTAAPSLDIAVLDDDEQLREEVIVTGLKRFGFNATGFPTSADLYRALITKRFQIAILDLDLPGEDGITVAYHLRKLDPRLGILMLSAHGDEPERIASLECGADGYLVKPIGVELLAAQLHSLWRRIGVSPESEQKASRPEATAPLIGSAWYLPRPDGAVLPLSRTERQVMGVLVDANGAPCTRDALIAAIVSNGVEFDPARLDVLVHRLRRKLAESARSDLKLVTVRGVGYALVQAES